MREASGYTFDTVNIESVADSGDQRVAPMQPGDAVKLLVERWDELDSDVR